MEREGSRGKQKSRRHVSYRWSWHPYLSHRPDRLTGAVREDQSSRSQASRPDGRMRVLPKNVYSFLCQLLAELQGGNAVTILQPKAQLTTREASKLLGMSRQFLVNLLERQEIPYHKVGTHRRIYARDIFAFKAKRDNARRKGLDDLARTEYAEGVYVKLRPDDSNPGQ